MMANTSKAHVTNLTPNLNNFARIMVFKDTYNGPPSNTIQFKTPEGVPSTVQSLQAFRMGSSAFMVQWKRPLRTNGDLTGYQIYYQEVNGTNLGPLKKRASKTLDPDVEHAKLSELKSETNYRIHVVGLTKVGEGNE